MIAVTALLFVIASLLFGIWWTVARINLRLYEIYSCLEWMLGSVDKLRKTAEAPHNLSQLTEIELPVLCAALNDLTQALAEQWHFNLNYRKN